MSLARFARHRPHFCLMVLTLGGAPLSPGSARGQSPAEPAAHAWSSQVLDALAAYQAGDYAGAQRLCRQARAQSAAPRIQQDAAVLEALCLLRLPARTDRTDGRTRLRELATEDPTLWGNPECNLAYGIAQTTLSETADALDALEHAAAGFATQNLPARQAAAFVALAEAWTQHGEWERTPPRFSVKRPLDAADAEATRRAQIAALRERVAALPDQAEALAQLDLVLAQRMLDAGDPPAEGIALLTRLANAEPLSPTGAAAALRLATRAESDGDWSAALRWYSRVQRDWHGDLAEQATRRAFELSRPQIVVDAPASVPSAQPIHLRMRTRGVTAVQLELRRVDVDAWLGSAPARGSETTLPESGSLLVARDFETPAAANGWWDSDPAGAALDFAAPPGAYALLVKGRSADGQTQALRRLVVVTDLAAACCVGPREALLWVTRPAAAKTPDEGGVLKAKFWMNRSFAATEVQFDGDIARFALPNEARVMRDKGWVCLVRSGDQLAICRGKLPDAGTALTVPRVALLAGPPTPRVGETLYISGLLLPGEVGPLDLPANDVVEVQVLDVLEKVHFSKAVPLSLGGVFAAAMPISAEQSGKQLRVLVRYRGQAVENLGERTSVSVPRADTPTFQVRINAPAWLPRETPVLAGEIRAAYPWGAAPAQARVRGTIRALHLPTSADNNEGVVAPDSSFDARLNDEGRAAFSVPLMELGESRAAVALTVDANVDTWDGRRGAGSTRILLGAPPPHAWLTHQPANPCVGQAVRFQIGWFAPQGLAVLGAPEIVLTRNGAELTRLPTYAGYGGSLTEPWYPTEPGLYDASAALASADAAPLQVQQQFEVGVAQSSPSAEKSEPRCSAHYARAHGQTAVHVALEGHSEQPLLVLLTAGDPCAGQSLTHLKDHVDLLLPVSADPLAGLRASVVRADPSGFELACSAEVTSNPDESLQVQVAPPQADIWPGTTVPVSVAVRSEPSLASDTTLTAWLVEAASAGRIERPPVMAHRTPDSAVPGMTLAVSTGSSPVHPPSKPSNADTFGAERESAELLWRSLSEGRPLWTAGVPAETNSTTLPVPVPVEPGLYKLMVLARTPTGAYATAATLLDARRGVRLALEAPSRLTLGDRSVVAVHVENDYAAPVEAEVRSTGGDGLHVESLRPEPAGQTAVRARPEAPVTFALPAGGKAWLYFEVEAAQIGRGQASVTVAARGSERSASGAYEILPPDAPPAEGVHATIRRVVEVWTGPRTAEEAQDVDAHGHQRWKWVPLAADERLLPGRFLRVTEDLVVTEPWPETTWSQRVPPTCGPVMGDAGGPEPIGVRQPTLPDALLFNVPKLGPGRYQHQYLLTAVCPGAGVVPAPQLRQGDTPLLVAVEPAELRLIVTDGQ